MFTIDYLVHSRTHRVNLRLFHKLWLFQGESPRRRPHVGISRMNNERLHLARIGRVLVSASAVWARAAGEGSTVSGLMDSFATAVSLALQYGVPLRILCDKFSHTRFEPSGWSGNPKIGYAKSLMDYLFRWLELRFLKGEQGILFERQSSGELQHERSSIRALGQVVELGDAPTCQFCGWLMVRNASC